MKIHIYKLKPGREKDILAWGKFIEKHREESLETLAEENCLEESFRLFQIVEDFYLLGAMCVADLEKGFLDPNMERELNREHFRILNDCIDHEVEQEKIYSLRVK